MIIRIEARDLAANQTLKFNYNGKDRTVKVEKVVRNVVKGKPYIHGFDVDAGHVKNFTIDNCGIFSQVIGE
jgi:hypothetical protein